MAKASKNLCASEDQLLEMIDFIKEAPILMTNKPNMKERDLWKKKWEELTEILNETEGPNKTVAAWQKEWNLLRNLTKEKMRNIETATQVRSPVKYKLNAVEERVAQLLRDDEDSMDTTPIPEESDSKRLPKRLNAIPTADASSVSESSSRRLPKRQNSMPTAQVSSLSVKSPSPAKRSRQALQSPDDEDADEWDVELFRDIASRMEEQNECFLRIAEGAANIENQCKAAIVDNVKLIKMLESQFK